MRIRVRSSRFFVLSSHAFRGRQMIRMLITIKTIRLPQIGRSKRAGGADHESESNTGLYRMQAPQLCDQKE